VRDVIAPGLRVLFVGINPGLYTAAIGHHFGRPGNRFWKALHRAGFTERELSPYDERELLEVGLGVTNLVNSATASAEELDADDLRRGAGALVRKVRRYQPAFLAFLGMGAYRAAFRRPRARLGEQDEPIGGSRVWLLANPSGRTASYRLSEMVAELRRLRQAASSPGSRTTTGI
jgi:TDG/mug DNA glycosylase family protein